MENFIFCAVSCENSKRLKTVIFFKTLHHQKVTQCLTMSQIHICRLKLLSTVQYIDSYFDMSTGILKKKKNPLETYYSINSHSQRFFRDRCSENFSIFTEKHLCWSYFLIKLQAFNMLIFSLYPPILVAPALSVQCVKGSGEFHTFPIHKIHHNL